MPFILYYEKGADAVRQWYVPIGRPVDQAASTLGIIAMSVDRFPGVSFGVNSPAPSDQQGE